MKNSLNTNILADIRKIIDSGRQAAYAAVSQTMIATYWHIGKRIVEEEQQGNARAEYGKQLIKQLSAILTHEYGKGFSARYLAYFRLFYLTISDFEILQSRLQNLTWTHVFRTLRLEDETKRTEIERQKELFRLQNG